MMKKIFSRTLSALLAVMMVISSMVVMALPTAAAETNSTIDMGDNSVNDLYTPLPEGVEAWDGTAATAFAGGTGTPEDPYLIANAAQYKLFADNCANELQNATGTTWQSASYKLVADIYINDFFLTAGMGYGEDKMPTGTSAKANRTPVLAWFDTAAPQEYACTFSGTFDGDGYTIYNGYWQMSNLNSSMFGNVSGTVKNLNVKGGYYNFTGWRGTGAVLAANLLAGGTVTNCHVNAHMFVERNHGGLIQTIYGGATIDGCSFSGKVKVGRRSFGGIACYLADATASVPVVVKNCVNYANIETNTHNSTTENIVGGIAAEAQRYAEFSGCVNYGTITSKISYAGGIIGQITAGRNGSYITYFDNCYNYGAITAALRAGGLAGHNHWASSVSNCANFGAVSATASDGYAGGLVGSHDNTNQWGDVGLIAINSANYGTITSGHYAGGFTGKTVCSRSGDLRGLVLNACVNAGVVTGTTGAGAAVGYIELSGEHNGAAGIATVKLDHVWLNGALSAAGSPAITHLTIGSNVYLDKTIAGFAGATDPALFESAQQYSATAMVDGTYLPLLNAFVNYDLGDEVDILWYQSTALGAPAPVTNLKVSNASVSVGTTPAIAVLLSGVSRLPSDAEIQLVNSAGRAVAATKVDGSRYRFDFAVELADIGLTDTYHLMVNGQKSVHSYELSVAGLLGKMYQSSSEAEQGLMVAMVNYSYYAGNKTAFDVFNSVAGTAFAPSVDGAEAIADAGSVSVNAGYEARLDISKGFVIIVTQNGDVISEHVKSVLNATDIVNLGSAGSVSVAAMLNHYLGDPAHADLAKAAILFYEAAVAAQDEAALGQ